METIRWSRKKQRQNTPNRSLQKDADGKIMLIEPIALINTLKNRIYFLNRAPKRESDSACKIPLKYRNSVKLFRESCANWQPNNAFINRADTISKQTM